MKKLKKDDEIVCVADLLDFTIGEVYRIHTVDEDRKYFMVIDNIEENNVIDFENFESYFKLVNKIKETKVVFSDYPIQEMNTPKHYDNSNGTLYKVATERGWNAYLFDIVKRLERAEKKGEFKTDLEKSKVVIDLWLKESEQC